MLARKIYKRWGVLQNENNPNHNTWNVRIRTPFNMSNDSGMFKPYAQDLLPLNEAKYNWQYNHRYCTWDGESSIPLHANELRNISYKIRTQYYLSENEVSSRFGMFNWVLVYRMITNATNERTMVSSIIPRYACGHSLSLIEVETLSHALFLNGICNSFIFDFIARQTVGGTNFNHWMLKQLPVVDFNIVGDRALSSIVGKVFELTYTCVDLKPMASEYGYNDEPFIWNEVERFQLQCELDAIYAHLYGLEKDEMEYIMETFPIVKRKDIQRYGSFRTKETILQLFDEFAWVREEVNLQKT